MMVHFLPNHIMNKFVIVYALVISRIFAEFDPKNHKNFNLINDITCGISTSERIIGGKEAPMNAFPWIARIAYISDKTNEIAFLCGGTVINSETVLSAAHCVTDLPEDQKVHIVRLGEHNAVTDPDCEEDICSDPVVDISPKEIVVPKDYNTIPFKHDIALIRLKKKINFNDFIKPICLVYGELYKKNLTNSLAEIAGWGIYDLDDSKGSDILQFAKLTILSQQECVKQLPKFIKFGSTQLCVGGEVGKDSCSGDSGGPLMMVDDLNGTPSYYLLGIVSFGDKRCGKTTMPGIYTKVSAYMEWILNNLNKVTDDSIKVYG